MKEKLLQVIDKYKFIPYIIEAITVILTLIGSSFLFEYSMNNANGGKIVLLSLFSDVYDILSILTVGIFLAILVILTNRIWLSCIICSAVSGIISVINYYVIAFHSMPLSFLVLQNFKTAMNVVGSYKITVGRAVILMIVGMLMLISVPLLYRIFIGEKKVSRRVFLIRSALLLVLSVTVFYFGYLSQNSIKPKQTLGWSWKEAYYKYGYVPCTVESFFQLQSVTVKPEGYTEDAVNKLTSENSEVTKTGEKTPDIILILNESFYDLRQVTDVESDIPYMSNIESMEDLLYGYAVVPGDGGGTNNSEYELLTSNSLQLMPGITPFVSVNLNGALSIVSHLNALGYDTLGTHTEPSMNYSRGIAYPAFGFSKVYFDKQYRDVEYYGDRFFETDESVYKNLIRWYEEAPEDKPRFQYLLTIQNHGAWERNAPEYDIVHTTRDYGEYTESVNEFLTGIYQSDIAFKELTEYYANVDRPVIICMVGDHAPIFAMNIADEKYSSEEKMLRLRSVPFMIWANFPLDEEKDLGTVSMNMVVPTLLDIADVKFSPYYSYMLKLKESVPVTSSVNVYYDRSGNIYRYDSDAGNEYEKLVLGYFYLEYQNLMSDKNREFYLP